uniref:Uncharacterized protein n=3 Tax=Enterobacteriaceae TaxID=543 RepID=A0A7T8R1A1_ECOLX|nr:hypothetical protein [Salmonella enterica subsp. enterica serovar Indiana]QQP62734.1 hypothetical protein [Escherichia coli]
MSIQPIIKVTFDRRCSFMFANCADMFVNSRKRDFKSIC